VRAACKQQAVEKRVYTERSCRRLPIGEALRMCSRQWAGVVGSAYGRVNLGKPGDCRSRSVLNALPGRATSSVRDGDID